MDDDGGCAVFVAVDDFLDVAEVLGVGEALVVDDDVVGFGPVGVVIEFDLAFASLAAFVDDGPVDVGFRSGGEGEGLGLKFVVVAASAGDEEGFERLFRIWLDRVCGEREGREADEEGGFGGIS